MQVSLFRLTLSLVLLRGVPSRRRTGLIWRNVKTDRLAETDGIGGEEEEEEEVHRGIFNDFIGAIIMQEYSWYIS